MAFASDDSGGNGAVAKACGMDAEMEAMWDGSNMTRPEAVVLWKRGFCVRYVFRVRMMITWLARVVCLEECYVREVK
jgi:hypothetical protein